jgi:hypothetical protein
LLPAKGRRRSATSGGPPEVFSVVIECRDEAQQREWFERLRGEGMRVRLLVL